MSGSKPTAAATQAEPEHVLVIRTCSADMTSHAGFRWPEIGPVECLDWDPAPRCGNGLHGLAHGVGDYSLLSKSHDAKWLVVKVAAKDIVVIDKAKVKFQRGEVVYCGDMAGALTRISRAWVELALKGAKGQYAAKPEGHAAAQGDSGHAAAQGDSGHAAAQGYSGHAAAQGYSGHAAAQGNYGHAAAQGDSGHAAAQGDSGHAAAQGKRGWAAVQGYYGRARAGEAGVITLLWFDKKAQRPRVRVAYVGEEIEAGVWYRIKPETEGELERLS